MGVGEEEEKGRGEQEESRVTRIGEYAEDEMERFWERMWAVMKGAGGQKRWEMMEEALGRSAMEKVTGQVEREWGSGRMVEEAGKAEEEVERRVRMMTRMGEKEKLRRALKEVRALKQKVKKVGEFHVGWTMAVRKMEACGVRMDDSLKKVLAIYLVEAYDEGAAEAVTRREEETSTWHVVMEAAKAVERAKEEEEKEKVKLRCLASTVRRRPGRNGVNEVEAAGQVGEGMCREVRETVDEVEGEEWT